MTPFASPVHVSKTLITIGPFCFLFAILNLCKFGQNEYYFLDQKNSRSVQITFIIIIFQIMSILKVRASNYLVQFVRYQAY